MKKGLVYVLITAVLFATLEPVSKLISGQIAPLGMTFIRFFIGGAVLLPFSAAKMKKDNIRLSFADFLYMAALGTLCVAVSMVLLQYAVLKAESPALVAIIFSCNSVITIILAAIILKDKITAKKILSLILCVIGILICSWKNLGTKSGSLPVALAFLAALTFSTYTVYSKKMIKKVSGSIQTGISFMSGSIILLIALLFMNINPIDGLTTANLPHMLFLGICVTGIGYWSYFCALEKSSALTASLAFFIKPILTPFVAFAVTGTPLTAEVFIALLFVLSGSYLASYSEVKIRPVSEGIVRH